VQSTRKVPQKCRKPRHGWTRLDTDGKSWTRMDTDHDRMSRMNTDETVLVQVKKLSCIELCSDNKSVGAACSRDSGTHRGYKTLPQKRSFPSLTGITIRVKSDSLVDGIVCENAILKATVYAHPCLSVCFCYYPRPSVSFYFDPCPSVGSYLPPCSSVSFCPDPCPSVSFCLRFRSPLWGPPARPALPSGRRARPESRTSPQGCCWGRLPHDS
jgi:hypothetical protein